MRALKFFVSGLVIGSAGLVAAQPPAPTPPTPPTPPTAPKAPEMPRKGGGNAPGGGQNALSADKAKAAWELEARTVVTGWGLSEEVIKDIVKAYSDARTSFDSESTKLRDKLRDAMNGGGGGGGGEMRQAMEDMNKSERDKLEKALSGKLNTEQTAKAMASMGLFSRQWDNMTDALAGFHLDAKNQDAAMKATEEYIVALGKARPAPGGGGDREAARTAIQEARKKLTDTVKPLLSEEQMKKFETAIGGGMGGRGGAGGGGKGKGNDKGGGGNN